MSSTLAGIVIVGIGLILTWMFFCPDSDYQPSVFNMLILFGPAGLISGCVVSFRGFVWGKRGLSRSTVRSCGLFLILFGGFPWLYTPMIIQDNGMEGSGMLGTILFIVVGLPGIAALLLSFFLSD